MPTDNDPFDLDSQLENDADRGFSNHDLAQQAYLEAHEARIAGPDRRQNYSKSRLFAYTFAVMPLDPIRKRPFFGFTEFTGPLSRPLTPTEVKNFYNKAQSENCNAGLLLDHPTDPGSSLCVIDVDVPGGENGDLTFVKLWLKSWGVDYREMLIVSTGREGGGFHFYARREAARSTEYHQQNSGKVFTRTDVPQLNKTTREVITDPVTGVVFCGPGSKVDCKAVRSYVVCPGAIHKSGVEYVATRNGAPVENLADVLHLIPVLPYAAWEEMRLPPTLATFERMQRAANPPYNFPLPFDLVKNRNYAEVVAADKEGRAVVAPVMEALPEGMQQVHGTSYSGLTPKPGKTFVTVYHPTSHPAYAVFLPLVGVNKGYTNLDPTETGYCAGRRPTGRQVSLGEDGALIVKDWVRFIYHVFTDRAHKPAKKLPGAPKAIPAYLLAQDLGPAEGRWTGRVEPIVLTALGFLPTMNIVEGAHVEVWQSTQGTGKTEQMKLISDEARNNGQRVVFVVPIRTLAAQASTRLALPHYAEAGGPITDSVVVTNVSLKRVTLTPVDLLSDSPRFNDNGVFFIDECEQVLDQVHKLGRSADGIAQRNVLIAHAQASARVILSDADAGPLTLAFLKDAGLLDVSVWRKSDARHPRTYVYCPGRPSVHKLEIIEAVSEGAKVAVAVMSRKTGESFAQLAATRLPGKTILLVSKSTILDGKVNLSTLNDNLAPVDLLIYTPVMGTGVSLDIKGHFDRVDLIATNRAGDGRQAMQMVMRVRHPTSTVVRVSGANCSEPSDAEKSRAYWHQTFTHQNAINIKMMAKVKNARQVSKDFEGWTPDLNVSKQNALHFLAGCESVAAGKRHGSSWVTRYLCGDDVELDPKLFDTDEAKLASAEESAIRDDQADAEAAKIAAVDPSSLVVLEQDNPALPEEQKECIRYARLLGAKWELATEADRKALVRDDESGTLTGEVHSFAATLAWSKNEDGKDSVMVRDEKDLDQSTEDRRRNRSSKAALTTKVLKLLGIDLHAPADVVIDPVLAAQVCALVSTWTEYLHTDVKLPKNWKDEPMRYPSKVLATVGLKLENERKRLPKEQGGTLTRVYTLLKSDVERMVALAAHQSLCLHRRESNIGTPGEIAFEAGGRTTARDFDEDEMLAMVYAA
jgi:hypothetical protein